MSNSGFSSNEFDKDIDKAESAGFEIISGSPNLLLLDFDNPSQVITYEKMLPWLAQNLGAVETSRWNSKTIGHFHVTVSINIPLDASMRVALQACLGSDPKKEAIAILRILNGIKEPSRLFKPEVIE